MIAAVGDYGVLVLADAAGPILRSEESIELRLEPERSQRTRPRNGGKAPAVELSVEDQPLFEALRSWRAEQAREQGVPAYVVFNDATLIGVAERRPASIDQLRGISGIGLKKLDRYGQALLEVVAAASPGGHP